MNGDLYASNDLTSIETCSDYISKEIQGLLVDYIGWINNERRVSDMKIMLNGDWHTPKEVITQFLNERYKEQ